MRPSCSPCSRMPMGLTQRQRFHGVHQAQQQLWQLRKCAVHNVWAREGPVQQMWDSVGL